MEEDTTKMPVQKDNPLKEMFVPVVADDSLVAGELSLSTKIKEANRWNYKMFDSKHVL